MSHKGSSMSDGGQLFSPVGLKGEQREDMGSAGILELVVDTGPS